MYRYQYCVLPLGCTYELPSVRTLVGTGTLVLVVLVGSVIFRIERFGLDLRWVKCAFQAMQVCFSASVLFMPWRISSVNFRPFPACTMQRTFLDLGTANRPRLCFGRGSKDHRSNVLCFAIAWHCKICNQGQDPRSAALRIRANH